MDSQGCGTINNNGERLVNFMCQQELCDRWDHLPTQIYSQTDMEIT